MENKRIIRRGTPEQIALVARELSRLARREVNINFVRGLFDSVIENQLLQKILSGNIKDINIRDLRHPRVTYEDRLEGIDRAGILKSLLPKTTRQLVDEIDDVKDITDENLLLYKNDLKRRIEEKVYESKEEYNELVERYDRLRQDLHDNELTGYFRFEAGGLGGMEQLVPAKPEQYAIYPELEDGIVDIPLLTEEEEKIVEDEDLDYLNKFEFENLERMRQADYELRIANFMEDSLVDTIQNLGTTTEYHKQPLIRDIGIKLVGTFLMNRISHYIPYIDMFNFFKRNKLTTAGVATAGYLGKLFYDYYTSQPGSKITPDLSQERGHVFSKEHNYNGPGTKVEERFELDNRKQGRFPYIFPSNVLDLIALEHDILYTSPNQNIQQLADLRYVENVRNPKQFLLGLNKRIGKELINPKDIDEIVKEFYANNLNLLSTGFIQSQAISRSIKNPLKLVNFYKDIRNPEMIIELFKPDQLNKRYGVDIQELYEKPPPQEYIKYLDDVDKSVDSVLTMMADIGRVNNKGDYVLNKKIENKEKFEKDLQTLHNNFNELVLEQRKIDNEDIDNINRYRQVKLEKQKINEFIKNVNKVVDDPEHIKTIKEEIINVEVPIKENDKIIFGNNIIKEKMVRQRFDSIYSYIDEINPQDRQRELWNLWQDGQKTIPQGAKDLQLPKYTQKKQGVSKEEFQKAYDLLQKELHKRGVSKEDIKKVDDAGDVRQMSNVRKMYYSLDANKPDERQQKQDILNKVAQERINDVDAERREWKKEETPKEETPKEETPKEETTTTTAPKEETTTTAKTATAPIPLDVPFITQPVQAVQEAQKEIPPEGAPSTYKTTGSTQNKDNPDNMVSVQRLTKKAVDKILNPTAQEKRRMNAGFYDFLTPDDQNGGIGTAKTNPLIRQNEQHEKMMSKGNLSSYYDNTLWGNNNNLLFKKTYNVPEIKREMKERKEFPKRVRGLIRKYPAYIPPQIQQRKEVNDFQPAINPPSNYYKGSRYEGFYRSVAVPLPYEEYVRRFYNNPNEFTAGADFY